MLTPLWRDTRTTWTPWRELRAMQRDLDRIFDQWSGPEGRTESGTVAAKLPTYEVEEKEDRFVVNVDLPGIAPGDVNVEVKDGRLQVSAESKTPNRERRFQVAFTIPTDIDEDKVEATLEHGVLVLALPKAAKPEARKIAVKGASAPERAPDAKHVA